MRAAPSLRSIPRKEATGNGIGLLNRRVFIAEGRTRKRGVDEGCIGPDRAEEKEAVAREERVGLGDRFGRD